MELTLDHARSLVMAYREHIFSKNLDAILDALTDDAMLQLTGQQELSGKEAIGNFYRQCFATDQYDFQLNITDEKIVSDLVFINGHMTRVSEKAGQPDDVDNLDFSFILKRDKGKTPKIWKIRIV